MTEKSMIGILTNFKPKCAGAKATSRTLPFASVRTARSTHLGACSDPGVRSASCQTLTVRSNEHDAMRAPCSGCAHETRAIGASCAFHSDSDAHSPVDSFNLRRRILRRQKIGEVEC